MFSEVSRTQNTDGTVTIVLEEFSGGAAAEPFHDVSGVAKVDVGEYVKDVPGGEAQVLITLTLKPKAPPVASGKPVAPPAHVGAVVPRPVYPSHELPETPSPKKK